MTEAVMAMHDGSRYDLTLSLAHQDRYPEVEVFIIFTQDDFPFRTF